MSNNSSKSGFNQFLEIVDKGRTQEGYYLPFSIRSLSKIVSIKRRRYTLIAGDPGSGKSAFALSNYAFFPYMLWNKKREEGSTNIELQVYIRSLERSQIYIHAKFICMYIYVTYGYILTPEFLLAEGLYKNKVSDEIWSIICEAKDYFEKMYDNVHIFDGTMNPTGIWKHLVEIANKYGEISKIGEGAESRNIYTVKKGCDNVIVIYIVDHMGRVHKERGFSKKENIDKTSEYLATARDFFHFTPVAVQQFNRSLQNIGRRAKFIVTPESGDLKDSGNTYEDCDLCWGLFDPYRYNISEYNGYDIRRFVSRDKFNRFRGASLMKNNFGPDGVIAGLNFIGECGMFKSLGNPEKMTDEQYKEAANPKGNMVE